MVSRSASRESSLGARGLSMRPASATLGSEGLMESAEAATTVAESLPVRAGLQAGATRYRYESAGREFRILI